MTLGVLQSNQAEDLSNESAESADELDWLRFMNQVPDTWSRPSDINPDPHTLIQTFI
jgi:hypothetical protein